LDSKSIELENAKTSYPLDTKLIISLTNEVEAYEDGIKKLENLKKEFGF
jgi:hypothetical protein